MDERYLCTTGTDKVKMWLMGSGHYQHPLAAYNSHFTSPHDWAGLEYRPGGPFGLFELSFKLSQKKKIKGTIPIAPWANTRCSHVYDSPGYAGSAQGAVPAQPHRGDHPSHPCVPWELGRAREGGREGGGTRQERVG